MLNLIAITGLPERFYFLLKISSSSSGVLAPSKLLDISIKEKPGLSNSLLTDSRKFGVICPSMSKVFVWTSVIRFDLLIV